MQYRSDKYGNQLSVLGYGCMRFTRKGSKIDFGKAESEVMTAFNNGVNYFDTAYIYPGSEALIGEILEKNGIRKDVYIATKLPHYMVKTPGSMDKIFDEELRRLRTDYVDYYLMHMLSDVKSWDRVKSLGMLEWLEKKKASGQIKQVGFSYHGNSDMFCSLLDVYDWDFCQIQYNYLDETSQAGRVGLQYAASKNIPVIIMEPLRGGKLATGMPKDAVSIMQQYNPDRSPAEWGLRWLWNQSEVTCVLSGMNSIDMVNENIRIASDTKVSELTPDDFDMFNRVISCVNANTKVGCTGCRYCMPCPKNVDIPGTFSAYNRKFSDGWFTGLREYFMCTALRKDFTGASNCVKCGKCEQHCPQHIEIRKELENAKKALETPIFKIGRKLAPLIMKY